MPLPPAVVTDLQRTVAAFARRSGLAFQLLPARRATDAPWLLVDVPRALAPRYASAVKQISTLGFVRQGEASGRLFVAASGVVLVMDDAPEGLEARLRGIWASAYAAEDDKLVKRLGVLLKAAKVVSEAEAAGMALDEVAPTPGEDGGEVVAKKAALWKRALKSLAPVRRAPNLEAEKLRVKVRETPPDRLAELVPGFLRATLTGLPGDDTPLAKGSRLSPEDQNLALAAAVSAWERSLVAWEQRIEVADALRKELDAPTAKGDPADQAHVALVAGYNTARLASERAGALSESLRKQVETLHTSLR